MSCSCESVSGLQCGRKYSIFYHVSLGRSSLAVCSPFVVHRGSMAHDLGLDGLRPCEAELIRRLRASPQITALVSMADWDLSRLALSLLMFGFKSSHVAAALDRSPAWATKLCKGRGYHWPHQQGQFFLFQEAAHEFNLSSALLTALGATAMNQSDRKVWAARIPERIKAKAAHRRRVDRKKFVAFIVREAKRRAGRAAARRIESAIREAEERSGLPAPLCFRAKA